MKPLSCVSRLSASSATSATCLLVSSRSDLQPLEAIACLLFEVRQSALQRLDSFLNCRNAPSLGRHGPGGFQAPRTD